MSETTNSWCPVCLLPALLSNAKGRRRSTIECPRCGLFTVGEIPETPLDFTPEEVANASGYIRANQNFYLATAEDIEFLRSLKSPTVGQQAEKLLRALAHQYPKPGTQITIRHGIDAWIRKHTTTATSRQLGVGKVPYVSAKRMVSMLSYGWLQGEDDLIYILFEYLVQSAGYLFGEREDLIAAGIQSAHVTISPAGWEFIQSSPRAEGNIGFIAMWFDAQVIDAYKLAIYPAIEAAGYIPVRIDEKPHNNRIDDEIIATIRSSRFVIADFTGLRGGVYYEAGFAGGLNIPVIWTVRDDYLEQVHFDTRQFYHIVWQKDDLVGFKNALHNRILAIIGKGPNQ